MRAARVEPNRLRPQGLWAALALVVLLLGVGLRGRSYIACTAMRSLHWAACCPGPGHDEQGDTPAARAAGCCVERPFASLGASERAPAAAGPVGVCLLAALMGPPPPPRRALATPVGAPGAAPTDARRSRDGPVPPPPLAERLARLGRLLC